ncbi:MAG: TIGR02449 family protein [Porticoccus sp.]|nr:TIGR02449 family protein [Porticoccus sp.]|tara:strand:- start:694 stop:900 length:207 start_codon:yes stop_codon:yes gene_type:complete
MSEDLEKLEQKIDRIIAICAQLKKENISLKKRESDLLLERSRLLEKSEMTRNRLKQTIMRLKNLNKEN